MNVKMRPVTPRKNHLRRKKDNCEALRDDTQRREYQEEVGALLRGCTKNVDLTVEESWKQVAE